MVVFATVATCNTGIATTELSARADLAAVRTEISGRHTLAAAACLFVLAHVAAFATAQRARLGADAIAADLGRTAALQAADPGRWAVHTLTSRKVSQLTAAVSNGANRGYWTWEKVEIALTRAGLP